MGREINLSNFVSVKNDRSSNIIEFECELRHIPSICILLFVNTNIVEYLREYYMATAYRMV